MSPTITLHVGPERTKFYVNEDTLCQLPFFEAALHGEFKEASEKTISMPEDRPDTLSALIEYLTANRYTYTYDEQAGGPGVTGPVIPISDLAQGLFHAAVYGTASKYDCLALAKSAANNLRVVLDDLDSTDALRVWGAAYAEGLRVPDWEIGKGPLRFPKRFEKLVDVLNTEHRAEMERTMLEHPALACDLLHLATRGSSR